MDKHIADILRDVVIYTDHEPYRVIKLPANAITVAAGIVAEIGEPFSAILVDKDEVTLVILNDAVNDFKKRLVDAELGARYRLITLDMVLSPDLIGFMATLTEALAKAHVSVLPYAAYSRDHILVPEDQLDNAIKALKQLKESARG